MNRKAKPNLDPRTLRRLRTWRELTQEDVAQRVGVPRQRVSDWERGRRIPTLEQLRKILEFLDSRATS